MVDVVDAPGCSARLAASRAGLGWKMELPAGGKSGMLERKGRIAMLQETISSIEGRIRNAGTLGEAQRAELLRLMGQLKGEITELSKTHHEQAESIASFTELSAREATRQSGNPEVLRHSIGGLRSSAAEFETSHPRLTEIANRIASLLANMGI